MKFIILEDETYVEHGEDIVVDGTSYDTPPSEDSDDRDEPQNDDGVDVIDSVSSATEVSDHEGRVRNKPQYAAGLVDGSASSFSPISSSGSWSTEDSDNGGAVHKKNQHVSVIHYGWTSSSDTEGDDKNNPQKQLDDDDSNQHSMRHHLTLQSH